MKICKDLKVFTTVLLFLIPTLAFSQTSVLTGKVTDTDGTPVSHATVSELISQTHTMTDASGFFKIKIPGHSYHISLTAIGFKEKNVQGEINASGRNDTMQIVLHSATLKMNNITITIPKKTGSINSMIRFQKNTSAISQVLSGEAISKSPDKNTGEALKRVTGISIQEGKYLSVRGLGDRYNQVMLNGILLSSTEPDRKTFSYDLFPSSIIENIVINKTFLPQYPGEWAGGLVQINTKTIPADDFVELQIGTSVNSETIGKQLYSAKKGKLDWLGFDDGSRSLPEHFPGKNAFALLTKTEKNNWGKQVASGNWGVSKRNGISAMGQSFRGNAGFSGVFVGKEIGALLSVNYNRSMKDLHFQNRFFNINHDKADKSFDLDNHKYASNIMLGAMGEFSIRLNKNHYFKYRNLFNSQTTIFTTLRTGKDYEANSISGEEIKATESGFKSNILSNSQLSGSHQFSKAGIKLDWFGSFGILDQYIPGQQRLQYNKSISNGQEKWMALVSNTLSQKTGSILYSNLSDYLYNAGADLKKQIIIGNQKQIIKAGYLFQIKDRLYNARPFAISMPNNNPELKELGADSIFRAEHFEQMNGFQFDEISGSYYRYEANSILHAAYLQIENKIGKTLELAWGVRYEHFDQITGSKNPHDPRYTHSAIGDLLPAMNITVELNKKTNLRIAGSQTIVRPEFRELTGMAFYDFELGATVVGNPNLDRTRISHLDLRYEWYPTSGELITAALFYKYFDNPIEMAFNQSGAGSSSTFNYPDNQSTYAKTYGVELEFRKKLSMIPAIKHLTVHGNFSTMYNRVFFESKSLNRPMQGQSPYLVNAGLQYELPNQGWSGTLLFNQSGRRILYVGNEAVPAVWEAPRPLLDLQISKTLLKNKGRITLNISDLFNKPAKFYHDLNKDKVFSKKDALVINRNYGTDISILFNYKIL